MHLPEFSLSGSDGKTYSPDDFANGVFVLYAYPRDMTPGCTIEARDFQKALPEFQKAGARVIGLSKDTLSSHDKFCAAEGLHFPLLSDPELSLIKALGLYQEKNMYGKKVMGVVRSTFLIHDGAIVKEWRNVKVPGHVEEVLAAVKAEKVGK